MASHLEQIRDNFVEVEKHIDGLNAQQAISLADRFTLLLLCKHIADSIGIEAIDGLPVIEWVQPGTATPARPAAHQP